MKFTKFSAGHYGYKRWQITKLEGAWYVVQVFSNADQRHSDWCNTHEEAKRYIARIEREESK
jgi:hypothetical protein